MNSLGTEFWFAVIGQTLIIIGAVIAAFMRTRDRITTLETEVKNLHGYTSSLKSDHSNLSDKVDGISRSVARIEGYEKATADERNRAQGQA